MRILMITNSLSMGGISLFTVNLANYLSTEHQVTLGYTIVSNERIYQSLRKSVRCVSYQQPGQIPTLMEMAKRGWLHHALKVKLRNHNKTSPMASIQRIQMARAFRTELPSELKEHFDVVISTEEFYCNDLVMMKTNGDRKIAWVHPDYQSLHPDVAFDRKILDRYDHIAVVSQSNRSSMVAAMPDAEDRIVYVPNLLNVEEIKSLAQQKPVEYGEDDGLRIVTVCRIDNSSKRLDRVVEICSRLKKKHKNFHWYLVGDGADRPMLEALVQEKNVSDCLIFLGSRDNPYPYVRYADVFVLTSQYEGRPIAVDEAMLLSCPVIVTEYAAAREQVRQEWGAVVPNEDRLCSAQVAEYLENPDFLNRCRRKLSTDHPFDTTIEDFRNSVKKILETSK